MDKMPSSELDHVDPARPSRTDPISEPSPLDRAVIDRLRALRREGRPSLLRKLAGAYFDASSQVLAELRAAVSAGDAGAIRQGAHGLRSSSLNLGASELAARCKELEYRAESGSTEGAAGMLSAIGDAHERACEALVAELEGEPE